MNKRDFICVIQSALLHFDGVKYSDLIAKYNINPSLVELGCHFANRCKELNLNFGGKNNGNNM